MYSIAEFVKTQNTSLYETTPHSHNKAPISDKPSMMQFTQTRPPTSHSTCSSLFSARTVPTTPFSHAAKTPLPPPSFSPRPLPLSLSLAPSPLPR